MGGNYHRNEKVRSKELVERKMKKWFEVSLLKCRQVKMSCG